MTARFPGRTALVTGGGSGIGQDVARAFAREGARVVVAGRSPRSLERTVARIEAEGGHATAIPTDVTDSAQVARLVAATVRHHGGLDIAVNAAGLLTAAGPVGDIDEDEWATLIAVNLTGTMVSMKHQIASMRRNGGGAIVNLSSTLGAHVRVPGTGAYGATKAAVSALTRNAALDHVHEGIRVNAVSPGPIDTAMSYNPGETRADRDERYARQLPAGRVGALEEVTAAVLYLASPQAAFLVGADLVIDGGAAA
ncbi:MULTISPECIES: SDR family NAD(P)-dependent oxidoreductase [Actinomadura]|uniref:SDR family NAD(P)-dependent oxidoreductase n=1 Tax=Actinomadura yumaensis TaxID=111807 RepID=A0ABW2CCG9_9ACTN|nr:glucose 1-dehydrogenase [Actinomadura sp. J1-007]MWK38506.1 glucose 1-dehydrogenase [Actinomadura sp. J1-007]